MPMTKHQRQSYAASVMAGLSCLMPGWTDRVGKFRHYQSAIRCKAVSENVLCFAQITVCAPRGTGPDTLSIGVGWTDDLLYDESMPIEFERPTAILDVLISREDAPDWSRIRSYVGIEHLKRRGGIFYGLNVGLGIEPEEVVEVIKSDFAAFGLKFLKEFVRRKGLSL